MNKIMIIKIKCKFMFYLKDIITVQGNTNKPCDATMTTNNFSPPLKFLKKCI